MILRAAGFAALVALVAVFPFFAGNYPVKLLQEILIWGIFAMSLDLLMGYAGMVSFGHSAFFGVGGYVAALALVKSPGLVSALLLRGANRAGKGQGIALWPTLVPAVLGALWYLFRAVLPAEVAPGAEYIAGPQYLLVGVIVLSLVAWIGCLIARRL